MSIILAPVFFANSITLLGVLISVVLCFSVWFVFVSVRLTLPVIEFSVVQPDRASAK
jgi:hypothetical protein